MEILDAQVHIVGENTPERPWDPAFGAAGGNAGAAAKVHFTKGSALTNDRAMLQAMDDAGVGGALLVATSHYGWDNSYSLDAAARAPTRFRVVGRVNHLASDAVEQVKAWKANPLGVGLRILVLSDAQRDQVESGAFDLMLKTAQAEDIPVCVCPWNYLSAVATLADRFPSLKLVVDHLGLTQPPLMKPDPDPFQRLHELLALAKRANVFVKLSAAPALSLTSYPFEDLWPRIEQIIEAFGVGRLMWGSDWTRVSSLYSIKDGISYLTETQRLSAEDKVSIMSSNLRRVFAWRG